MSSASRLVVHAGTHKTGSTAIQRALAAEGAVLADEGFHVIEYDRWMLEVCRAGAVTEALVEKARRAMVGGCRRAAGRTVVVSFEGFAGDARSGYANTGAVASILAEAARGAGCAAEVVVFLRRQDELVESIFLQGVKEGVWSSLEECRRSLGDQPFDWQRWCEHYDRAFGRDRVTVVPYCGGQPGWSSVSAFGSVIGSPHLAASADGDERPNPRYTRTGFEVSRRCSQDLSPAARRVLRDLLTPSSLPPDGLRATGFLSAAECDAMLETYLASNAEVARRWRTDLGVPWTPRRSERSSGPVVDAAAPSAVYDEVATWLSRAAEEIAASRAERRSRRGVPARVGRLVRALSRGRSH